MTVNENRIKENLNLLSFPRVSGSKGEKKAFEIIHTKLNQLGIDPMVQNFKFSIFYSRVYPKIAFFLGCCFLLVFFTASSLFGLILQISIIMVIFLPFVIITRNPEKIRIGNVLESKNLIVTKKRERENNREKKDIIVTAHVDSKSQLLPMIVRVTSIKVWVGSVFGFIFIYFLRVFFFSMFNSFFKILELLFLILNAASTFFLVINKTENESPGAIDNCSGVVCLLEIIQYFFKQKFHLKNYDITFVFTGAEETGTMGIRFLYDKIKQRVSENSFIVNIDAIANNLVYFSSTINSKKNSNLFSKFKEIATQINLDYQISESTFGVRSDGQYLKKKGFYGYGLGDLNSYKHIHTKHDTVDKVDASLLKKASEFTIATLEAIDKK